MKALTLWQPWASAIALGLKRIETRSLPTYFRGELAICAAKKSTLDLMEIFNDLLTEHDKIRAAFKNVDQITFDDLPVGCVVALVSLDDCLPLTHYWHLSITETEKALGDYSSHRFAWMMRNVRRLKTPIPVIGRQGLFNLPPAVEAKLMAQL